MSELQNSAPPPKKRSGLGWFLGGFGLVILICFLLCCGGVATVGGFLWYQVKGAEKFKKNIETLAPVKYSGPKLEKEKVDAAFNRCVDAMETVRKGEVATLTLSQDEFNNLHEERVLNNTAEIPGLDILARKGGVKGRVSVPDPEKPGYLTMDIDLNLEIVDSKLTFEIVSLKDLTGQDAPITVRKLGEEALRQGLLYGEGNKPAPNADGATIQPTSPLYALKSLTFEDGNIQMEIDPARVKEHNKATGKPEDAPLFEGN